eukprot:9600187-Lingulodinium_polyedra.AAC.1
MIYIINSAEEDVSAGSRVDAEVVDDSRGDARRAEPRGNAHCIGVNGDDITARMQELRAASSAALSTEYPARVAQTRARASVNALPATINYPGGWQPPYSWDLDQRNY